MTQRDLDSGLILLGYLPFTTSLVSVHVSKRKIYISTTETKKKREMRRNFGNRDLIGIANHQRHGRVVAAAAAAAGGEVVQRRCALKYL
jgi:hypothetical protein